MTSIIQKKCLKKGGYLRSSGDKVAIAERFTHSTHFAKKKKTNYCLKKKKKKKKTKKKKKKKQNRKNTTRQMTPAI